VNLTVDILTSVSVIDAIAVQVEAMVNLPKKFFLDEMTRGWAAREPTRQRVHREAVGRSRRSGSGDDLMEMLADGQKVMAATAQMLAGGWKGGEHLTV
jgi:hypothetical protein